MTDKVRYAFEGRVDLEPEQAWKVYRDLPEPTVRACARVLWDRGVKVSYDTVARWARRGNWRDRVEQLRAVTGVGSPKDVAAALKVEAEALTPELLRGLQFRLALRMAEQLNQLALDRPEDFDVLGDGVAERLLTSDKLRSRKVNRSAPAFRRSRDYQRAACLSR
jgi:hypothetical protein